MYSLFRNLSANKLPGWTSALGWQCGVASASYLTATMIQGLVVLNNDTYTPTRWQGTLIMIGVLIIATFTNTLGARHLPLLEGIILVLHILGFFCIIIPLWILGPKAPTEAVFTEFFNGGGWSSTASASLIAQLATVFSFVGKSLSLESSGMVAQLWAWAYLN
jgi:choline transport protein